MNLRECIRLMAVAIAICTFCLLTSPRATAQDTAWVHFANASNTVGNLTYLDHPFCNNNPRASLMVTPTGLPYPQGNTTFDRHNLGVWYDGGRQRWAIFHQDSTPMSPVNPAEWSGTSFNVWANSNYRSSRFVQVATAPAGKSNCTYIDNASINGNPYALLYITQVWDPENHGYGGIYNDALTGVFYDSGRGQWAIMNIDGRSMPTGAAFFVFVDNVNMHFATSGSISANYTLLDDSWTWRSINALTFITTNVAPYGVYAAPNQHVAGVMWNRESGVWSIINQDYAPMLPGSCYNTKQILAR